MSTLDTTRDARAELKYDADLPSEQNLLAWTHDPDMAGHVTAQSSGGVAGRVTLVTGWASQWYGVS